MDGNGEQASLRERFKSPRVCGIALLLGILFWWGNIDLWAGTGLISSGKWLCINILQSYVVAIIVTSRRSPISWLGKCYTFLHIILGIVNVFCYHYWHFGMTGRLVAFVLETTPNEAQEFASTMLHNLPNLLASWHTWGIILALGAAAILLRICPTKWTTYLLAALSASGLAMTVEHIAHNETGKKDISLIAKTYICYSRMSFLLNEFHEERSHYCDTVPDMASLTSHNDVDRVVLLIGESSNKYHWGIYGYENATTPKLAALKDELVVCTDVIPPYGSTSESLRNVLTFRNSTTAPKEWYEYANIVTLFHCVGYKIYWLSNQEKIGYCDCTGILSESADYCRYVGPTHKGDNAFLQYDGVMLPILDSLLNDTDAHRKLIAMHTLGSHFEYKRRYPEEFAVFGINDIDQKGRDLSKRDRQYVAEYDNSILYTDHVLASTIEMLRDTTQSTILIYASDHTDDVYDTGDCFGHATMPDQQIHIPVIIWANEKYRKENPNIMAALEANSSKPYDSENLIHTILGLTHTNYSFYDATQDLSSDAFEVQDRYFEGKKWDLAGRKL